jgi:F-type H+-transporting ATPase subunit delta
MPEIPRQPTTLDSGQQQAGTVYAKALLATASKAGQADSVLEEFDAFLSDVLDPLPALEATLASPRVPLEAKIEMLDKALAGRASETLLNFLKVVCRRRRFDCIRAMNQAAHRLFLEMTGRVAVQIRTATPISDELQQRVASRLEEMLGKRVVVSTSVEEQLIGGLVVRVRDTVYDGSLAHRLKALRETAVENVAQVIGQSVKQFEIEE